MAQFTCELLANWLPADCECECVSVYVCVIVYESVLCVNKLKSEKNWKAAQHPMRCAINV